ncbi:hypothetical protein ES705_23354 [subsurface metagenome]
MGVRNIRRKRLKIDNIKKFDLNIEKILEDWEKHHAICEVIANAIDEELLSKTKKIRIFKDNKKQWHIKDYGRGLKHGHLTQKEDVEKLKSPHVIGKFGIGLKDALATFDRKKVKVYIKSRHGDITLGKSEKHDFKDIVTLHAYVHHPSNTKLTGTEFILKGCSDRDMKMAKELFLRFSNEEKVEVTRYGQVLKKGKGIGRIYVNGVRVAEEENFIFSYNITALNKSIRKALNRERTNVGRSAYSERVKSILLSCTSKRVAKILVNDLKLFEKGTLHDELRWLDVSVHACKLLNSLEQVIFLTPDELLHAKNMVDLAKGDGYRIVTIPGNVRSKIRGLRDTAGNLIRDLDQYKTEWDESFEFKFIDEKDMTKKEKQIFKLTNKILKLIGGKPRKVLKIRISETMRLDSDTYMEVAGLWDEKTSSIIIKRDQLRNVEIYASTLLHEVAHVVSGEEDVTREFENQLSTYLGLIASKSLEKK